MHRYRFEHNGLLPPAFSVDVEGRPLHSWRVLILPYLDDAQCEELYRKIRLDEPWDSEYNRQFHAQMPDVFRCPALSEDEAVGETNYAVIMCEKQLFDLTGAGRDYVRMMREEPERQVAKMSLIIERIDAVPWMCPDAEPTPKTYLQPLPTGQHTVHASTYVSILCIGATSCVEPMDTYSDTKEICPYIDDTAKLCVKENSGD